MNCKLMNKQLDCNLQFDYLLQTSSSVHKSVSIRVFGSSEGPFSEKWPCWCFHRGLFPSSRWCTRLYVRMVTLFQILGPLSPVLTHRSLIWSHWGTYSRRDYIAITAHQSDKWLELKMWQVFASNGYMKIGLRNSILHLLSWSYL